MMRHVGELFKIVMVVTGGGDGGGGRALGVTFRLSACSGLVGRGNVTQVIFLSFIPKVKTRPSLKNIGSLQRDVVKRTTSDL